MRQLQDRVKLPVKQTIEASKNSPAVDTPKFTRAIEANKNAIIAKFCAKLLPAKILPALEKGAKY